MKAAPKILIVGFGDIGERLARLIPDRFRVYALVRDNVRARRARMLGVTPIKGDLARIDQLASLTGLADIVFHFAPPPGRGRVDTHTRHLLDALSAGRAGMLPQRVIYISTTGVYGDRQGAWVDESSPPRPATDRARRRVDAERALGKWGRRHGVPVAILRAPGIYAGDRLPLERLKKGLPVLSPGDDVYTNHIHADDLTGACWAASRRRRTGLFNVVDDSDLKMGDYFNEVADHFGLTRPPRVSRAEARAHLSAAMISFMSESRRINNARLKRELRFRLRYPTVQAFLRTLPRA